MTFNAMSCFYNTLTNDIVLKEQLYLSRWHQKGKYWDSHTRTRDILVGGIRMIYDLYMVAIGEDMHIRLFLLQTQNTSYF